MVLEALHNADAEEALTLGYDLMSVGKSLFSRAKLVRKILNDETVEDFADIHDQQTLHIPSPFMESHGLYDS